MRLLIILSVLVARAYCADFTTYIGDTNQYQLAAITVDSAGNTYATGGRVIQPSTGNPLDDVFVTKLDAAGNIVFTTTFGGKANDYGNAIAVDPSGNIWVGGVTTSVDFPLHNALQTALATGLQSYQTGFLVELAQDGTVIYSSYFGGLLGASILNGVATDQGGNVYVTGTTNSSDFPTTAGLPAGMVNSAAVGSVSGTFITKLDATGSRIVYSALIAGGTLDCSGGSNCSLMPVSTEGTGIAIDGAGDAMIVGNTNTIDLPVTPGGTAGTGAFAAKVSAAGNELIYLTYLGPGAEIVSDFGPSQTIDAVAIVTDGAGDAYLTGNTNDPDFPATAGAYKTTLGANATNAFAIKLDPSGRILWATYLGGPGPDSANSISLDGVGDVWLAGTHNAGFPTLPTGSAGGYGDFVAELSADGSSLLYSAEFSEGTAGQSVAIDQNSVVHFAGQVGLVSTITPSEPPAPRVFGIVNAAGGQVSGRVAPGEVITIVGFGLGPVTPVSANPHDGKFPTSLGGVRVLVNGTAIPLLYVSGSQINAEIPAPFTDATDGEVQVANGSEMLPAFRLRIDASDFGVFLTASGSIAAINQDGTINSAENPAKAGSIVAIWATGFDPDGLTVDGAISKGANNWCSSCQITVGSVSETVAYAGAAPGLIDGLLQINFMVPGPLNSGTTQPPVNFENRGVHGFIYASQ